MDMLNSVGKALKAFGVHLFGRGIMTAAVTAAGVLSAMTGIGWVLPVVAIGGVVITAANRLYDERTYKNTMLDLYRQDIAKQLGIDPRAVTREHLTAAARDNEVIEQALTRQRRKTLVGVGAAILSSVITVTMVTAFGADSVLKEAAHKLFENTALASAANFVGIGTVAGISSLIFSSGLQEVLRVNTGFGKASAHDRILQMQATLNRGHAVTKEQVYGVLVASDPALQQAIQQHFGKRWRHMKPDEQRMLVAASGAADDMQRVAEQINRRDISPGHLAFVLHRADASLHDPLFMSQDAAATTVRAPTTAVTKETAADAVGFVEKLGLRAGEQGSFRERVSASRIAPPSASQMMH